MKTRWISMRRAAGLLAEIGINRESARQALHAGLAGPVTPTGAGHLVDEHLVRAVIEQAQRSADDLDVVERLCRTGVFVGRLGPRAPTPDEAWRSWRGADITAPEHEQRAAAAG